jgi:hypothetical protein
MVDDKRTHRRDDGRGVVNRECTVRDDRVHRVVVVQIRNARVILRGIIVD